MSNNVLAFKPEADDIREASSIIIINEFTIKGAKIVDYDPKAIYEAQTHYLKDNDRVLYVERKYEALKVFDAVILVTDCSGFSSPDFDDIKILLSTPVFFGGRNQFK